jgi:hypothetical protein
LLQAEEPEQFRLWLVSKTNNKTKDEENEQLLNNPYLQIKDLSKFLFIILFVCHFIDSLILIFTLAKMQPIG